MLIADVKHLKGMPMLLNHTITVAAMLALVASACAVDVTTPLKRHEDAVPVAEHDCTPNAGDCGSGAQCAYVGSAEESGGRFECIEDGGLPEGASCGGSKTCGAGAACIWDLGQAQCRRYCVQSDECGSDQRCQPLEGVAPWGFCAHSDWSCLGEVTWSEPATPEVTVTLGVYEGHAENVEGAVVRACAADDVDCVAPLAEGLTDRYGKVALSVPTGTNGFDGYFDIDGEGTIPLLYHRTEPFAADEELAVHLPRNHGVFFAEPPAFDASRGQVRLRASGCDDTNAIGMSVLIDADSDATFYTDLHHQLSDEPHVMRSGSEAFVLNVQPGATNATGLLESSVVAARPIVVRAGSLTSVQLEPAP